MSKNPGTHVRTASGPGRSLHYPSLRGGSPKRRLNADRRMYGGEKSDVTIVATKPAHNAWMTTERSRWSQGSHPRGKRKARFMLDSGSDFGERGGPLLVERWLGGEGDFGVWQSGPGVHKRLSELGQVSVVGDGFQFGFCIHESQRHPAVDLCRVSPTANIARQSAEGTIEILNTVGGAQALAELFGYCEPLDRERFLHAFLQTLHGLELVGGFQVVLIGGWAKISGNAARSGGTMHLSSLTTTHFIDAIRRTKCCNTCRIR